MIEQPIKKEMNKLEAVGRIGQWVIELSQFNIEYNIEYKPRAMIKAQVLANFIAEFTLSEGENMQDMSTLWTIHMDGSSVQNIGFAGDVITSPEGDTFKYGV